MLLFFVSFLFSSQRKQKQKTNKTIRSSADAADAYDELDGIRVDDRTWKVHRATKEDFEFFRWKWFEDDDDGDVRDDYRYDDKKRDDAVSTRRGHSEDATGSPSPDDKKYSGRASPLREEYD